MEANSTSRVECLLEVAGSLKLADGESIKSVPLQAAGRSTYDECILLAKGGQPSRSVRKYNGGSARLTIGEKATEPALAEGKRLIVADWAENRLTLFCPVVHLTREDIDLISMPGDSLLIDNLLPDKDVAIGDRWEHGPELLAALCGIDAVNESDVASELKEIDADSARFEMAGKLAGAAGGVGTEIELKAKYTFDRKTERIRWLALLVKEKRAIGHAAPGVEATSRLQLKVHAGAKNDSLAAAAARLSANPTADALLLHYASEKGKFEFDYDRRWQLMSDDDHGAVFRLIDQGDLIAQLNVMPVAKTESGQPVPLARFQADIEKALGENFGQFVTASQNTDLPGRLMYRVVASGKSEELPVEWIYYLIAGSSGDQVLLIFTLETDLAERFRDADRPVIDRLRFITAPQRTALRHAAARGTKKRY